MVKRSFRTGRKASVKNEGGNSASNKRKKGLKGTVKEGRVGRKGGRKRPDFALNMVKKTESRTCRTWLSNSEGNSELGRLRLDKKGGGEY